MNHLFIYFRVQGRHLPVRVPSLPPRQLPQGRRGPPAAGQYGSNKRIYPPNPGAIVAGVQENGREGFWKDFIKRSGKYFYI